MHHALEGKLSKIVENVDKIIKIAVFDCHLSALSIAQQLKIAQKLVWNHWNKAGLQKKLNLSVPHEITQKKKKTKKNLTQEKLVEIDSQSFASSNDCFYESGITKSPTKWLQTIEENGACLT